MRNWVNEWVQEGAIYVWRYDRINRARRGWHFTGDPAGCRSIRNLLDRMKGGEPYYRTIKLGQVTEEIWNVPDFGIPKKDKFATMRVQFSPEVNDLSMSIDQDRLVLTLGNAQLKSFTTALAQVENGDGDFGIGTSEKRNAESWMFWWM